MNLDDIFDVVEKLDITDVKKLKDKIQTIIEHYDYNQELKSYQSINKVSKTMGYFDNHCVQYDYLMDFDCWFETDDIYCEASYSGERGMFSPKVKVDNCFEIPRDDFIYHKLLEEKVENVDKYITDMNSYKMLCKHFKYKKVTLAKKIVQIVHSMQGVY